MKVSRFIILGILFCSLVFLAACGNSGSEESDTETTESEAPAEPANADEADMSGPEYTSEYVCPMHCEGSGSAEPGTCPVCGMEYVASADLQDGGGDMHDHDHGHDHDGHDHQH